MERRLALWLGLLMLRGVSERASSALSEQTGGAGKGQKEGARGQCPSWEVGGSGWALRDAFLRGDCGKELETTGLAPGVGRPSLLSAFATWGAWLGGGSRHFPEGSPERQRNWPAWF